MSYVGGKFIFITFEQREARDVLYQVARKYQRLDAAWGFGHPPGWARLPDGDFFFGNRNQHQLEAKRRALAPDEPQPFELRPGAAIEALSATQREKLQRLTSDGLEICFA